MERSLEELETIIRATVCRVCTDQDSDGSCGLEDPGSCALFRLFPQVARAIQTTYSDDIRDYVKAIREVHHRWLGDLPQTGLDPGR